MRLSTYGFLVLLFKKFLTGQYLPYSIVMDFAIHESAIGTHMSPPLNPLLPTFLPMLSLQIVTEQRRGLCFDQVQCIYFFLFLSVLLSNKSLPSPVSWSFCFMLSSKFYSFSSYVQGIDPFWVCFLHMWKWKSLSHVWPFGILQARTLEWVAFPFSRGIFPKQGLNPGLPHCGQILYQLSHQGSPFCTWCKVKRSPSFLCMWISHFPSTVHWRNCSFSIEWS